MTKLIQDKAKKPIKTKALSKTKVKTAVKDKTVAKTKAKTSTKPKATTTVRTKAKAKAKSKIKDYSKIDDLKDLIVETLDKGKAVNLVTLDIKGKSSIADYIIIASGTSDRHTSSLAQNLLEKARKINLPHLFVEGMREGNWVIVDFGDIIVHLFKREFREIYDIENMWKEPLF